MGKKDVVHPGQFKVGGRLRPGKDTNPHLKKQDYGQSRAETSGPGGVESAPPMGSPQTQEQGGVQRRAPKAGAVGPPNEQENMAAEQQENMDVTSATGRNKEQAQMTGAGEPSRAPTMDPSEESSFTPAATLPGETAPEPPKTQAAGAGGQTEEAPPAVESSPQTSIKSGVQSTAKKLDSTRHGFEPHPATTDVPGAFGKTDQEPRPPQGDKHSEMNLSVDNPEALEKLRERKK